MEAIDQKDTLPLVSIVITSYNRAKMIGEAIESALAQDYPNLEVIITDNCSTDNTKEVIEKYLYDKRIKFFQNEENIGMIPNFKKGIEILSSGEYFISLCSDDVLTYKSFVTDAIKLINRHPNVTIVRGKNQQLDIPTRKISENTKGIFYGCEFQKGEDLFLQCVGKETFGWEGVLLHRGIFNSLNIFRRPFAGFDKGSNLSLLLFGNICFINQFCYLFRMHSDNSSRNLSAQSSMDNFELIEFPYSMAVQRHSFDKPVLDNWKNTFVLNFATDTALGLYKNDKNEYEVFLKLLRDKYRIEPSDLNKSLKSRIMYSFFYFPVIGRFFVKVKKRLFLHFFTI